MNSSVMMAPTAGAAGTDVDDPPASIWIASHFARSTDHEYTGMNRICDRCVSSSAPLALRAKCSVSYHPATSVVTPTSTTNVSAVGIGGPPFTTTARQMPPTTSTATNKLTTRAIGPGGGIQSRSIRFTFVL